MDRISIKERAKQLLKKNHWLCVGAAFFAMFAANPFSISFNSSDADVTSSFTPFGESNDIPFTLGYLAGFLLILVISSVATFVFNIFVSNQFVVGGNRFFLKYRRNNPVDIGEIFQSYKDKSFLNIAKATFMRDLFLILWSMLCIIPGVIKTYEYWAFDYILAVNPNIEYQKALDLSKKMMNGNKMRVFELQLSFIGWYILSLFTCGILAICYVNPYQKIAMTELYCEIREDAVRRGVISPYDVPDYIDYIPQSPYYPYTPFTAATVPHATPEYSNVNRQTPDSAPAPQSYTPQSSDNPTVYPSAYGQRSFAQQPIPQPVTPEFYASAGSNTYAQNTNAYTSPTQPQTPEVQYPSAEAVAPPSAPVDKTTKSLFDLPDNSEN